MADKSNWVYIKYKRNKNTHLRADHNHYHFRVFNGVSLALVRPSDVETVLKVKQGCCGQPRARAYFRATEDQITSWLEGKKKWESKSRN